MTAPRKRLYSNLVALRAPKEISGDSKGATLQEVSSFEPSIVVPQGDDDTAERIRTLRLFDLALTPADMAGSYGLPAWALDTARLVRANQMAKQANMLPSNADPVGSTKAVDGIYQERRLYGKALEAAINRANILHGCESAYDNTRLDSWDDVVSFAKSLYEEAKANNEPDPPPQPQPQEKDGGNGRDSGDGEPSKPATGKPSKPSDYHDPMDQPKGTPRPVPTRLNSEAPISQDDMDNAPDPWSLGTTPPPGPGRRKTGHCENFDKPDVLKMEPRKRHKGVRRRADYSGTVMGRVNRLFLDGKIFKAGKIRGGYLGRGSIMVDLSGSMCWTEKEVGLMLEVLPECSVYGYCGRGGRGRIVLLADRGKTVNLAELTQWKCKMGSGNEIDDSALRFLGRQSKPRIWISDGGVCASGCDYDYMHQKCNEAIVAGAITRINRGTDIIKLMKLK